MSNILGRLFARVGVSGRASSRQRRMARVEALEPRLALSTIVEDDNWQFEDGGMKDLNSGLVWSQSFQERTGSLWTYGGALNEANNLVEGGFDDWRLPTQAELQEAAAHGFGNHYVYSATAAPSAYWSTAKCNGAGGSRHLLISTFDGSATLCAMDASGLEAIAVRGTRSVPTHTDPNIRVFSELVYTNENGANGRFTVVLDTQPTADVTIPVWSEDTTEGTVAVSQLVFTPTNWNVPQGVTITPADDVVFDPNSTYHVVLGPAGSADALYGALDPPDVVVVNHENNHAIIMGTPDADRVVVEDGSNDGLLNVRLGGQPSGPVTVDLAPLDGTEGALSQSSLTFDSSNWNVVQTVIVYGVADGVADGDQRFEIEGTIAPSSAAEFLGVPGTRISYKSIDADGAVTTYSSGNVNLAIPDPGTVTSTIVVPTPSDGYDRIGDLNISLNINHTYDSDLTATLISPSGQRIELFSRMGGSGDNFTNTTLDDEALSSLNGAPVPFTGTFRPENGEVLAALDGSAVAGTWKLEINDALKRFSGTLVNWSLRISRIPNPMTLSAMDEALMLLMAEELSTTSQRK